MFTIQMNLGMNDWFLDLAIKDRHAGLCDVRQAIAVFYVSQTRHHVGLVQLPTRFCDLTGGL